MSSLSKTPAAQCRAFHAVSAVFVNMQVAEEVEAQYVSVEDEGHLTEAPLAVMEDNGSKIGR